MNRNVSLPLSPIANHGLPRQYNRKNRFWQSILLAPLMLGLSSASLAQPAGDADATNDPSLLIQWAQQTGEYPKEQTDTLAAKQIIAFPSTLKRPSRLLLTQLLPPVVDQGLSRTTTSWAVAYYCYSYAVAKQLKLAPEQVRTLKFQFSPAYLNAMRDNKNEPLSVPAAFKLLEEEGCASLLEWPANEKSFSQQPDDVARKRAVRYRARDTIELFKGKARGETPDISQIKSSLAYYQCPLVMTLPIWPDFPTRGEKVGPNFVYDLGKTPKGPTRAIVKNARLSAVTVVGYDDDKKAFRIVHSWGDKWGDGGFLWVAENFIKNYAFDGWIINKPGGPDYRGPVSDRAVVVGINQYPGLKNGTLKGCRNDAQAMAGTLKEYGFDVTMLLDEKATRANILSALQKTPDDTQKNGRLVFYFAGHGSQNPLGASVLLPADANEESQKNDLKTREINQALLAVPARSRTVLLDACASGGMLDSSKSLQILNTRYYRRSDAIVARIPPAMGTDANKELAAGSGDQICYFTASRSNQQATEALIDGYPHGAFTYSLLRRLNGDKVRWGELQTKVSDEVRNRLKGDLQQPTVSPSFVQTLIFDERPDSPTFTWDDFNADHVNPAMVQVQLAPDKTTFKIGETFTLSAKLGAKGYLIIVDRGTSGDINLLFPQSRRPEDAIVDSNVTIPPKGWVYRVKKPLGTERIKAVLVFSREKAAALLGAFNEKNTLSMGEMRTYLASKNIELIQLPLNNEHSTTPTNLASSTESPNALYTSDVTFEIVE